MSVHEFFHGFVAYKLGDSTAKYSGRLTLNPLAHLDIFWTVILPILLYFSTAGQFVFGAAKPVPINYSALRNPKRDIIWVGLAGPLSNLVFAFLLSLILRVLPNSLLIAMVLENLIMINIVLGIFNLIPIPPLDGSRIVMGLLPDRLAYRYVQFEQYGFIIVMVLIWMGALNLVVWPAVEAIYRLFMQGF
jgi:Zn-dependent protease